MKVVANMDFNPFYKKGEILTLDVDYIFRNERHPKGFKKMGNSGSYIMDYEEVFQPKIISIKVIGSDGEIRCTDLHLNMLPKHKANLKNMFTKIN